MTFSHDPLDPLDAPPSAVLDDVDAAWARAASLAEAGIELRVSTGRIGGRLRARLCVGGEVVARLTPAEALAVACESLPPAARPA